MGYQALYRVYRSQTFAEVVGQEAITTTLRHAVAQQKISHAYLFSGPRGTGKTSVAKIFAKAVNCLHPHDGEPCNECELCVACNEGRLNDVIEIDAASNNGVEEIRDIRDKAKYAPTIAKYKVYIIDEVHMLSKGAFNALLKTLEEPPQNVIFILATTEMHKIPATIISRTQRFMFKRIGEASIIQHLEDILNKEHVSYEREALSFIARLAEGGMRDALSLLDQVLAFSDNNITLDEVMEVTGSVTYTMMDEYMQACIQGKVDEAIHVLHDILAAGKESLRFIEDLLSYCRDLLIYKQAPEWVKEERAVITETFIELANQVANEVLYQMIADLMATKQELKLSVASDIYLEVLTVKLATKEQAIKETMAPVANQEHHLLKQLQTQVSALEKKVNTLNISQSTPVAPLQAKVVYDEERVFDIMCHSDRTQAQKVHQAWEEVKKQCTLPQQGLLHSSEPKAVSCDGVVIVFSHQVLAKNAASDATLKPTLIEKLTPLLERPNISIEFIDKESWEKQVLRYKQKNQTTTPVPKKEAETVSEAKKLFGEHITVIDD